MSILAAVLVVETAALSGEVQTNSAATEVRNAGGLLVKEAVLREDGLTMEIRTEGIEALIKEALDETQN